MGDKEERRAIAGRQRQQPDNGFVVRIVYDRHVAGFYLSPAGERLVLR